MFTLNTATHAHVYPKCTPIAAMLSTHTHTKKGLQLPEAGSRANRVGGISGLTNSRRVYRGEMISLDQ